MKNFNLGTSLSVRWNISTPDGKPFSLAGYTYTLRYKSKRGSGIAKTTSVPTGADGNPLNIIVWSFSGPEQTSPGIYDLELSIYASGRKICVSNYVGAFSLERKGDHPECRMPQDKYGCSPLGTLSNNAGRSFEDGDTEVVDLYSVAEWWAYKPVEPVAGADGFWYVNGVAVTDDGGNKVPTHFDIYYDESEMKMFVYEGSAYADGSLRPSSEAKTVISSIRQFLDDAQAEYTAAEQGRNEEFMGAEAARRNSFDNAEAGRASAFASSQASRQAAFEAGERERNTITNNAAAKANSAASLAETKAGEADAKGEAAIAKASFAKIQGDYAKEQGDYAKENSELAQEKARAVEALEDRLEEDIVYKSKTSPATPAEFGLVKYTQQSLNFDQQAQARKNISAAYDGDVMHKDGDEFVEGEKTFTDGIMVPFDQLWRMGHDKNLETILNEEAQRGVPITYAELVTLRNNGQLVKGAQYRITDYVCTTVQEDTQSAGHQFDIIVTADSASVLNKNARAIQHEGDTYFADCDLATWELKYSLDNDTERFAWADANGKGVIFYMKDEWENECPYDFKSIKFKRYKVATVTNAILNEYVGKYIGIKTGYGYAIAESDFKWFYTFSDWSAEDAITDASIIGDKCGMNRFDKYRYGNVAQVLNNNTIVSGEYVKSLFPEAWLSKYAKDIANNDFSGMSYNNSMFGHFVTNTSSGGFFRNNTIYGTMRHNDIATNFQENAICGIEFAWNSTNCEFSRNIIDKEFQGNTVNGNTYDNVIGSNCSLNTISVLYNATLGKDFLYNELHRVYNCTIGDSFQRNYLLSVYDCTFGTAVLSNTFRGQINACKFGDYAQNMAVEGICSYIETANGTSANRFTHVHVCHLRGTSDSSKIKLDSTYFLSPVSGVRRHVTIEGSTDGKIIATWKEGLATKGVYKDSATATTWNDIP